MEHFPLYIKLSGQRCLVVGGGKVALRKCMALTQAKAGLTVIAPRLDSGFHALTTLPTFEHTPCVFEAADDFHHSASLQQFALVIAATDDAAVNEHIATLCKKYGVLVNVASQFAQGNTIIPATITRGDLTVTVSTTGASPSFTQLVKRQIDAFLPQGFDDMALKLKAHRQQLATSSTGNNLRRRIWRKLLSSAASNARGVVNANLLESLLQKSTDSDEFNRATGEVFLVGAGPGDPELLTLKALRVMQQADVVLYDRLVSDDIMALLPEGCEKVYVGKRMADHALPQTQINEQLLALAKQGRCVVRLKGGDPFIFGRGGEEIELLATSGVSFQVIPGVTAASGCASYAGIPLTHRDYSQSVRFITGHLKDNSINLNWQELVQPNQTLVFYMGLTGLQAICDGLMAHGSSSVTPIALVEKGTTAEQRVFTGTLSDLPEKVKQYDIHAPTLIIIGDVVSLHEKLSWFNCE